MKTKITWFDNRDRKLTLNADTSVAWEIAQTLATQCTHKCTDVTIAGTYGTARFNSDGTGQVIWNDKSTCPGTVHPFTERTIVCIF